MLILDHQNPAASAAARSKVLGSFNKDLLKASKNPKNRRELSEDGAPYRFEESISNRGLSLVKTRPLDLMEQPLFREGSRESSRSNGRHRTRRDTHAHAEESQGRHSSAYSSSTDRMGSAGDPHEVRGIRTFQNMFSTEKGMQLNGDVLMSTDQATQVNSSHEMCFVEKKGLQLNGFISERSLEMMLERMGASGF